MSDPLPTTLSGAAAQVGNKLVATLPAQFLMLCFLNVIFICGLLWFLDKRDSTRERVLGPIIAACMEEEHIHARPSP